MTLSTLLDAYDMNTISRKELEEKLEELLEETRWDAWKYIQKAQMKYRQKLKEETK